MRIHILMKNLLLFLILCTCVCGCAPNELPRSHVPPWDSDVPPDLGQDSPTPRSLPELFFGEEGDYHFRKVRWGYSRERVALAERGNRVYKRTENELVYGCKLNGVNCALVYTFKDNKLRTAGYLTIQPIPHADNLIKAAVDKYGVPDIHDESDDGFGEMVWKETETVIYANLDTPVQKRFKTHYRASPTGGLFKDIPNQLPESVHITYLDGAYAHVDRAFFNAIHESAERFPLDDLSSYEKRLTGVTLRGKQIIIPGLGTIPGAYQ